MQQWCVLSPWWLTPGTLQEWVAWGPWGACSPACGPGTHTRQWACVGTCGGCSGADSDVGPCNDGEWSAWARSNARGLTTTITTAQLVLSFIDDGSIFNANNLNISLKSDSFWTNSSVRNPSMNSLNDPGNLFGTFHNLDTLSGMQNLNCSQLQATFEQSDAIPFYP
jgi:hypothetical protein